MSRDGQFDVIVLGLGAMGSAASWQLAQRGLRTLGIEQFEPAHDRGSSHGESRIIRQAYFEGATYVPFVLRAYELWRELEERTGAGILTVTGGVMLGPPGSRTVTGAQSSAERWGLPHELLDATELTRRFPTFVPTDDVAAVFEPLAGFVRPEAAVRAQLRLAEQLGATLHFGERVTNWSAGEGGPGCEVLTEAGRYRAERLVICAGPWAPAVLGTLGVELWIERQVIYWFQPRGPVAPYLWDRHPIWIWETPDPAVQLYGFPALSEESGVKVAFFHGGRDCSPETIERAVGEEEVELIGSAIGGLFPDLGGTFLRVVTCMYTNSPDEHFVIGQLPGAPGVTVACGFSGHGFKFAPAVGELLAELATGSQATVPGREFFEPSRFRR